jgi:RNA polymerase sigma-70 factor (ECF subfamily)
LVIRIVNNRETAEELTLDVFHDVWRGADKYHASGGTMVGWICYGEIKCASISGKRQQR